MFSLNTIIWKSVYRRKKETIGVAIAIFLSMTVFTGMFIIQQNSRDYVIRSNMLRYGNWAISERITDDSEDYSGLLNNDYFGNAGKTFCGKTVILNEHENDFYFGCMDDDFYKFSNISLYEGRMPEKPGEIALDHYTLSRLGLCYETGQTIKLGYYNADKKVIEKSYVVTGVLKDYFRLWETAIDIPSVFVCKDELASMHGDITELDYYCLKANYSDVDSYSIYKLCVDNRSDPNFYYNNPVYRDNGLLNGSTYTIIFALFAVIGTASISYMSLVYFSNRGKEYYNMRCFGANKYQIIRFISSECFYICTVSGFIGVFMGLAIGAVMLKTLAAKYEIAFRYAISIKTLLIISAILILILSVVLISSIIASLKGRLYENTQLIKPSKIKSLKRYRLKKNNLIMNTIRRQNRIKIKQTFVMYLYDLAIACVIVFCVSQIYWTNVRVTEKINGYYDLFSRIFDTQDEEYLVLEGKNGKAEKISAYGEKLSKGLSDDFFSYYNELDIIDNSIISSEDAYHYFDWKDRENSNLIKETIEELDPDGDILNFPAQSFIYKYRIVVFQNNEEVYERLSKYVDSNIDYERFKSGEYSFMILGRKNTDLTENTISQGEIINVSSKDYKGINTKVAGIIYRDELTKDDNIFFTSDRYRFEIVASNEFGKRLMQSENKKFYYNTLRIYLKPGHANDNELKSLISRLYDFESDVDDSTADKEAFVKDANNDYMLYSMILFITIAFYLLITMQLQKNQLNMKRGRFKLLKNMGMSNIGIYKMVITDLLLKHIISFISIPIIYFVIRKIYYHEIQELFARFTGERTLYDLVLGEVERDYKITFSDMQNRLPIVLNLVILIIIFVVIMVPSIAMTRRIIIGSRKKGGF